MNKIQEAEKRFTEGYACSQAVFSTYCDGYNIDPKIALCLSAGLGGGVCMGKTCGAVTGAILTIGLVLGENNSETGQGRQKVKESVIEFTNRFKELNSTTECKDLLSTDISTSEGMKTAIEDKLFKTVCPKFIRDSSEILEEIIANK